MKRYGAGRSGAIGLCGALLACGGPGGGSDGGDGGVDAPRYSDGAIIDVSRVTGQWSVVPGPGGNLDIRSVWGAASNDFYAVNNNSLLRYNGTGWTATTSMYSLASVSGTATMDVWVLGVTIPPAGSGQMGSLVMQHNGVDQMPNVPATLGSLSFRTPSDGWAVGFNGSAAHYDGASWAVGAAGLDTSALMGVMAFSATDAIAIGEKVWRWTGTAWTAQPTVRTDQAHSFYGVWGSSADDVWVVGQYAFIQRWVNGQWIDVDPGNNLSSNLNAIWGAAANDIWAVGDGGAIIHWNGVVWELVTSHTTQHLRAIWGVGAGDIWAVGDRGIILHYR